MYYPAYSPAAQASKQVTVLIYLALKKFPVIIYESLNQFKHFHQRVAHPRSSRKWQASSRMSARFSRKSAAKSSLHHHQCSSKRKKTKEMPRPYILVSVEVLSQPHLIQQKKQL
jgi:hypothetical protein